MLSAMMVLAAAAQTAPATPATDEQAIVAAFVDICHRPLRDPRAVRAAIRASPLGFARAADERGAEVYRSATATIRFEPGRGCELEATLPDRSAGNRAIARLGQVLGLAQPMPLTNHPGTATYYHWPPAPPAGQVGQRASLHSGLFNSREPARLSLWAYISAGR